MLEVGIGTLLAAYPQDDAIVAHRLTKHLSLLDGEGERFLQVDVFLCLRCLDGDEGMPVVRRGDHHRIDILTGQQVLVVLVHLHSLGLLLTGILVVHPLQEALSLDAIDIAAGYHTHTGDTQVAAQQVHGLLSQPDKSQTENTVICLCSSTLVLGTRCEKLREHGHAYRSYGGCLEKLSSC